MREREKGRKKGRENDKCLRWYSAQMGTIQWRERERKRERERGHMRENAGECKNGFISKRAREYE